MATTTTATTIAGTVIVVAALLLAVLPGGAAQSPAAAPGGAAPAPSIDCFPYLANVSDCLTYVEAGSNLTKPDKACCPELKVLVQNQPVCLCQLLGNSDNFGIQLNLSKALKLPSVCGVDAPPVSLCSALATSYPPSYMVADDPNDIVPSHPNHTSPWNPKKARLYHTSPWNPRKTRLWLTIGGAVAFLLILASVFLLCYLRWRNHHFGGNNGRRKHGTRQCTQSLIDELKSKVAIFDIINNGKRDHDLPLFSLSSIEIATDYFSDANEIGKGGFGPVYKGKLVNGQEIAVKRLSRTSKQGLEEFKNEVVLISRLQHRNLVKLWGCCIEGDERILIYEYLPNKSLDSILSDVMRRALLDWKKRVNIIEGIAQGLLYLHKYSRLRIIHRDLKTANILLDNNLNPKISDFGTARIFGDNESRANTNRIIGTYGYMSPEYASHGLFSEKSDVFSFGVMMLEIISGRMNTDFYQPDRAMNLLGCAWDLWKEGRGSEIMDAKLVETCSTSEVMRYIQVGFLCVQENAGDRPTMLEVASMLSNEMIAIPVPKQPAFSIIVSANHANTPEIPKPCSINGVTISEVEAR